MCFFENVEGHISLGLSTVISDLEELGYKVSFGIFSASEVGAVHQRKRVFIMAHRKDERFQFWKTQRWGLTNRSERTEIWDKSIGQGGVSGEELAHRSDEGLQGGKWFWQARAQGASSGHATECGSNEWPSRPGQPQYAWEPPRVVGNSNCGRFSSGINTGSCSETDSGGQDNIEQTECGKIEPEMGRDIDGTTYGVDIAELSGLCHSELEEIREWMVKGDNRTDELRSCGNGVVPATAERAFRILMEELINK
jgi:site-specific DNA-cytosine methylase